MHQKLVHALKKKFSEGETLEFATQNDSSSLAFPPIGWWPERRLFTISLIKESFRCNKGVVHFTTVPHSVKFSCWIKLSAQASDWIFQLTATDGFLEWLHWSSKDSTVVGNAGIITDASVWLCLLLCLALSRSARLSKMIWSCLPKNTISLLCNSCT